MEKNLDVYKNVDALEVLDNLPGVVFRVINDGHWTFAYASKGVEKLLGYTKNELVDVKKLRQMIPAEDLVVNKRLLRRLTPENPHLTTVYRVNVADGRTKWVREEATGIFSKTGKLLFIDGFLVDITDQKLKEQALENENTELKSSLYDKNRLDNLIGQSLAMKELFDMILKAAKTHAPVVITGETGTGKELTSRAIHRFSPRKEKPFVVVNCGAISENLLESEFFGYKKGAFTGALSNRKGFLDAANKGTLFLDELGEISQNLQVKLLRVLDGEGYIPVGETKPRFSDFRLITATNSNLEALVRTGKMREDFYYRINTFRLRTPPLRDRKDDIILLANHFLAKFSQEDPAPLLSRNDRSILLEYSWPGNVRELQNTMYRYLVHGALELSAEPVVKRPEASSEILPAEATAAGNQETATGGIISNIEKMERKMILDILEKNRWHIGNAARDLGFSRRTMQRRMKKYHLKK